MKWYACMPDRQRERDTHLSISSLVHGEEKERRFMHALSSSVEDSGVKRVGWLLNTHTKHDMK